MVQYSTFKQFSPYKINNTTIPSFRVFILQNIITVQYNIRQRKTKQIFLKHF